MSRRVNRTRIRSIVDMAVAFAVGSVVVVPMVAWIKSKLNLGG